MKSEINKLEDLVYRYPEYQDMITELLRIGLKEINRKIEISNNIKKNNDENKKTRIN